MQFNTIYNFEDIKNLLSEKVKEGAYFLLSDDLYFEEIQKNMVINREVYLEARKFMKTTSVLKYLMFNIKKENTTKDIYEFIQVIRKDNPIILTIFNKNKCECTILFVSNKNESILKKHIKNFLELEDIDYE